MTPPQLTADTPVFDVFQPVAICIFIFSRVELQFVVHYRRQSHVCKVLHAQEPLHRKFRLDSYVGAFRETYLIGVSFYLFQQVGSSQVFFNLFTNIKAIHAYVHTSSFADSSVVVENIDRRQVVFFSQHIVVYIVCRSYFQTTGTKLNVYIVIFDNRNDTSNQRNDYFLTFQPLVFRVVWIDTHCSITHNCFRTCSSYYCISAFRIAFYFVAQIEKFTVFFFVNNFFIAEGSQSFRVPVYHTYTAVNQPFIV